MTWLTTILREIFGLFVDDGAFAVTILVWLAVVALVPPRLGLDPSWTAVLLFAGLAVILIESATRRARR